MGRKTPPPLSPSETQVLQILWRLGDGTVADVRDELPADRQIAYATVQTLLRRLEGKGYVTHKAQGKAHLFRPAARPEDVVKRTVGDFVERLFGGDPMPLMLHLAENNTLDPEDVQRLKKLIARSDSQSRARRG